VSEEIGTAPGERRLFRGGAASGGARSSMLKTESICGAILASARTEPEARALEDSERALSYAEFENEVVRLANALAGAGVRRGSHVALFVDRSIDAVVAAIAIMLAGAACVPIDPSESADRIGHVMAATSALVAVGRPAEAEALGVAGVKFVDPGATVDGPTPALPPLESDDAAYVVASAGPNSPLVSISHGDVLALLGATRTLFAFGGDERWALLHSLRSDVALWEMAACLATGGTGVIVPTAVAQNATAGAEMLESARIGVLIVAPSIFRNLAVAQAKGSRAWPALRWVVLTGEPIDRIVLRRFRASHPGARPRFANMYGVAEATIFSTFKLLEEPELAGELASPLGFTLAHQEIVLYDEGGTAVPAGTAGEIWIRGSGVAEGYLDAPELARERFVRRATPDGPARFFRTGDLARRRPNGELEYLGRVAQPREPGAF
jgi:non-ribosomal peptide synthetase component F